MSDPSEEDPSVLTKPSIWINPDDPDHPAHGCEVDPKLPPIPILREGWYFDLRDSRRPAIFYNGSLVGRVMKVAFKMDANDSRLLAAHLEIANPAFVIGLTEKQVEVTEAKEKSDPPLPSPTF